MSSFFDTFTSFCMRNEINQGQEKKCTVFKRVTK